MTDKPLVLIVEDSSPSACLLKSLVELAGGVGQTVNCVCAALEVLQDVDPALVIVDMHLPDGNGIELARKVRELKGDKTIIWACSGDSAEQLVETAWDDMPFDGWLPKPFNVHDVMQKIADDLHVFEAAQ